MLKTKIFVLIIFIISSFTVSFAADDLYLDYNNFCQGETTFTLWNQSQWEQKNDLDEDEIDYLEDADVVVYNGPFDSSEVLYEGETNNISEFTTSFPEVRDYLIEITNAPGNFTKYEEYHFVETCSFSSQNNDEDESGENSGESMQNNFTFNDGRLTITFTNSSIEEGEIDVKTLEQSDVAVNDRISDVVEIYDIQISENREFDSLNLTFDAQNSQKISIYSHNEDELAWNMIKENGSYPETISTQSVGTFALTALPQNPSPSNTSSNTSSNNQQNETQTNQSQENTIPTVTQSQESSNLPFIAIGVILGIALLGSPFLFSLKKHKHNNDEYEALSSYKQEYEKTKNYVNQYKDSYNQEAIRTALIQGNIPKDIIDKVFEEVYR